MNIKDRIKKAIEKWLNRIGIIEPNKPPVTTPEPPVTTTPTTPTQPTPVGTDALPWETIHWEGGNHAGVGKNALPNKVLRSARIKGNMVYIDYDQTDDWGLKEHNEGGSTWKSYARLCAFSDYKDGALRGAHFDWLSVDGSGKAQKAKVLSNIFNGYLYKPAPSPDARFWFAVVSNDGKYRTNLCAMSK